MKCVKCGAENNTGAKFCSECGCSLVYKEFEFNAYEASDTGEDLQVEDGGRKNWIAIIAAVCLAVSTVLPYVSALGMSKSLLEGGDGIFIIGLAVLTLAAAIKDKNVCIIICGIFGLLIFGLENSTITDAAKENSFATLLLRKDMGYYLMMLSSIAIIIGGIIGLKKKKQ